MIRLFDILKEITDSVQYSNPNFEKEWMEAKRYPEFKKLGKTKWVELAKDGYVTKLSKIKSVLSNVDLDFDSLEEPKKQRFEQSFEKGIIELPIVVKFGKNEYDLVAGNTRIAGLVKYNINPTIWVVEL